MVIARAIETEVLLLDEPASALDLIRPEDRKLEDIRNKVLAMGSLVEEQIENAIKALVNADVVLVERVICV